MSDLTLQATAMVPLARQPRIQLSGQSERPSAVSFAAAATIRPQTSSNSPSGASPRLVKAAHEFEASMMKELLAPMQPGKDALDGEDENDNSNAALTEFASEALGKAISERGGLGIARSILHQLDAGNRTTPPAVTGIGGTSSSNSSHK